MINKIIVGEMDGQPIWREKTAREELLEALEAEEKRFKQELVENDNTSMTHISKYLDKHYKNLNNKLDSWNINN